MPKVDFGARRKEAEQAGMIGEGGFYKYQNGDNRIRLVSECEPHTSTFADGKKSFKWLCYVLDRRSGKVRAHFMPHTIYKAIEALQLDPEYAFDEVPMPYDINVKAVKAGTIDVEYTVMPARKAVPLTEDELQDIRNQKSLRELKDAIKGGKDSGKETNGHDKDDEAAPF